MYDVRTEIELKLRGNLLRDWCRLLSETDDSVVFDDAWCSGYSAIRFSTKVVEALVEGSRGGGDCWGLGRAAFYELENTSEFVALSLVVSPAALNRNHKKRIESLVSALNSGSVDKDDLASDPLTLITWPVVERECDGRDVAVPLDDVWNVDVAFFQRALGKWLAGDERLVWRIPDSECNLVSSDDVAGDLFVEGAQIAILTDRFERSRAARRRCIAAHGTACAICGVDFGELYGERFAGKIEVHHKKPLSEIREDYEVDPVNDLVPVCPNCHMILHSKSGNEPYTIEEVRGMLMFSE